MAIDHKKRDQQKLRSRKRKKRSRKGPGPRFRAMIKNLREEQWQTLLKGHNDDRSS